MKGYSFPDKSIIRPQFNKAVKIILPVISSGSNCSPVDVQLDLGGIRTDAHIPCIISEYVPMSIGSSCKLRSRRKMSQTENDEEKKGQSGP